MIRERDKTNSAPGETSSRYARHLSLPGVGLTGQEKLKHSKALIVGLGGIGGPIALYLAAAGVGNLVLVDDDVVSLSNLQRQILFSTDDIGLLKVAQGRSRLVALNPEIQITAIGEKLTAANARKLVSECDVVIDGTDNFKTRYLVNDACVLEKKPLVFGAVFRFDAQVSVFAHDGPCYRCLYPEAPGAEASPNCADAGVLGVLPGTTGTLMATEALKIILGIGETLSGTLLTYDALGMQFFRAKIARRVSCEVCGDQATIHDLSTHVAKAQNGLTVAEMKARIAHPRDNQILIDVRNEDEFAVDHLAGSRCLPLAQLAAEIDSVPRDASIILVCQSGVRSKRAAEILEAQGFRHVENLQGGLTAYREYEKADPLQDRLTENVPKNLE